MKKLYKILMSAILLIGIMVFLPETSVAIQGNGNGNPCNNSSKYLYWVGDVDNDFFNENNWRETNQKPTKPPGQSGKPTCLPGANKEPYTICLNDHNPTKDKVPKAGTLTPGQPIGLNLYIDSAYIELSSELIFACEEKGLTISNTELNLSFGIEKGVIALNNESTVRINSEQLPNQVLFDFLDAASWIYWNGITPDVFDTQMDQKIRIGGLESEIGSNYRINQYYQTGSVIRPIDEDFTTLTIYDGNGMIGQSGELKERVIYKGGEIPNGLENSTRSFILKRGYMATFAAKTNGTGKGKVYIASEEDMVVESLPVALDGNISFIRVVPWNWVTKKGTGGLIDRIDAGWYYNWGLGQGSFPNFENAAMAWGAGGASPSSVNTIIDRENVTHFLGFNESDHCTGQSGQFNNLCEPEVAVAYFEGMLASGLRIGSPAPRENGPFTWLREFTRIAKERDVRFDFVAVHWYDWGGNPANTPNANPQQIFNRFKTYLERVHNEYQMPIWITEFNANPNRGNSIQEAFLQLALPYLESLEYVERYAYFQPNPNNSQNPVEPSNYLDEQGNLTNIGELFLNFQSSPSIPEATYAPANSLEGMDLPYIPKETNTLVFEAECGDFLGSQWDIMDSMDASNGLYIKGNPQNDGENPIARQVHFEFDLEEGETYRVWLRANTGGTGAPIKLKIDNGEMEQIGGFNSNGFGWLQVPRFYDLNEGKHRLTIEFPNPTMSIDQIALINGSMNVDEMFNDPGYCDPTDNFWGLEQSDTMEFFEAESANFGSSWSIGSSETAINELFLSSADEISAVDEAPGVDGVLEIDFEVETPDEYELWTKIQALGQDDESSLWIAVDSEPFRKMSNLENSIYVWYWKPFYYSYPAEQRGFSYFLEAGDHTLKVAYASGNVAIDRFALVTKGKDPRDVDPDVLFLQENLEFEAEHAALLGTSVVANCAASSNGQQVNIGNQVANGVRFEEIVAELPGAYRLDISYMSAVSRVFRVIVNGQNMGQNTVEPSGPWCFNGGTNAIFEMDVQLVEGLNTIEIRPISGDAPIVDKIKLEKTAKENPSLYTLEAEEAELLGNVSIQNCQTASNGQLVNMGSNLESGVRFSDIILEESKVYSLEIHYVSAVERSMTIVNGITSTQETFEASGPWCFDGGEVAIKTIQIVLEQGPNFVEFRPNGTDAPIIDRIFIKEVGNENLREIKKQEVLINQEFKFMDSKEFKVYPNPVKSGELITIQVPGVSVDGQTIQVSLTDVTGRTIYSDAIMNSESQTLSIDRNIGKGLYIILIKNGNQYLTRKLIVE